jgi:diguanylate cyclase (GGDEF)-like protein/PAS domain S-box-containing protein
MNVQEELKQLKEENDRLKHLLKIQNNSYTQKNDISDLVDIKKLQNIFNKFSKLTGYTTGFIKQDTREVLISTGWTDICKTYHRGSKSSEYICQESNTELTKNLQESHHISMKECQHGMVDGATPIIIDGEHLADIFSGQVLFDKPNIENFKHGADEFGYDMEQYLEALQKVKISSKDKLKEVLEFLSAIAEMIAKIGKDKKEYLKLNASLEQTVKERVKETESLLALFNESDNVLFKWNNDAQWSVSFVSQSVSKLLGYSKSDFENNKINFVSCIHPDDTQAVMQEVKIATSTQNNFFSHKPYRIKTKDGNIKWILDNTVIIKDENGKTTHYLGYLSDITELKEYQKRLELLSQTDQLTKIKNRLYLDEILQQQYYKFLKNKEKCTLILVDIDYFKDVNDTYGHIIGDLVLVEFATILSTNIGDSNIVGRWGGEEFLIILPQTNITKAKELANKLRVLIENFTFTKVTNKTASFGVSEFQITMSIEESLDAADQALYKSKKNGRNQVH